MPKQSRAVHTSKTLEAAANELAQASAELRAIAIAIEQAGFESLEITNYDGLTMGIRKILGFSAAAKTCLFAAKQARSDFRASDAAAAKAGKKK